MRELFSEAVPYSWILLGVAFLAIAAIYAPIVSMEDISPAWHLIAPFAALAAIASGGAGFHKIRQRRRHLRPLPAGRERELLSAIREKGSITPVEASMSTSLTVREADRMLSELAGAGHLRVESEEGALFYSLPGRRGPEIGD